MSEPSATVAAICAALRAHSFAFANESELQDGIATAFLTAGIPFVRESALSVKERPDFIVGSVAVEVKLSKSGGSPANTMRQLSRYLRLESIDGALLVTTSMRMAAAMPSQLHGKPIFTHHVGGGF